VAQEYFPDKLAGRILYEPGGAGYEKTIAERVNTFRKRKKDALKP